MSLCATALLLLGPLTLLGCDQVRASIVRALPESYDAAEIGAAGLTADFDGDDPVKAQLKVRLDEVASGLPKPTDIQFPPGESGRMLVSVKEGQVIAVDLATGEKTRVLRLDVPTASEQGILGLAFHPRFPDDPRVFINHTAKVDGKDITRVAAWKTDPASLAMIEEQIVLQVVQPYANHNAGQLAFGPDGFLYIGFGDGGWANDPKGHGQNAATMLGSMLRIDIDQPGVPYGVPADNPFLGDAFQKGGAPTPQTDGPVPPETWAIGLRNPWRYSFDPDGRLIVADVGQNLYEEVSILPKGGNAGWKIREAAHCFEDEADCSTDGLIEPVFEYGREAGASITGGYVYTGAAVPALAGRFLVGDFATGRIWGLALPEQPGQKADAVSLGKWPLLISTFGRDAAGEIYVADYKRGTIYRVAAGD